MKRIIFVAILAFAFGLLSAYLSISIFDSIDVDADHPKNHWYDFFMVTLIPAGILNHFTVNLDLSNACEDAFDKENVFPYMVLNGFAWMCLALLLSFLIFLTKFSYRHIKNLYLSLYHAR